MSAEDGFFCASAFLQTMLSLKMLLRLSSWGTPKDLASNLRALWFARRPSLWWPDPSSRYRSPLDDQRGEHFSRAFWLLASDYWLL